MADSHTNSAVAPAVAVVVGIILLFTGPMLLNLFGALLIFGGGILFVVRVIAMLAHAAKKEDGTEV